MKWNVLSIKRLWDPPDSVSVSMPKLCQSQVNDQCFVSVVRYELRLSNSISLMSIYYKYLIRRKQ